MKDTTVSSTDSLSTTKPSLDIVERVAELEGTDPTTLTPPLYAAIDPEALDSLCQPSDTATRQTGARVSFTYCGYDVDVREDGEISVTEDAEYSLSND